MPSSPPYGFLQLGLVHLRTALDVAVTRFVVQLVPRATAGTRVRSQPTAPAGRDVVHRRPTRLARLATAGPLLVHGAGSDLLRGVFLFTALQHSRFDVLVLPFTLLV